MLNGSIAIPYMDLYKRWALNEFSLKIILLKQSVIVNELYSLFNFGLLWYVSDTTLKHKVCLRSTTQQIIRFHMQHVLWNKTAEKWSKDC